MPARLNGHGRGVRFEAASFVTQLWREQLVFVHPAYSAARCPNLHCFLEGVENVEAFAEADGRDGLADLRGGAPERDLAIAGVGHVNGTFLVMEPQVGGHRDDHEQGEPYHHLAHQSALSVMRRLRRATCMIETSPEVNEDS